MARVQTSAVGLLGVVGSRQVKADGRKGFMRVLAAGRARRRWRRNARSRRDEGKAAAMTSEEWYAGGGEVSSRGSFLCHVFELLMERVKAVRVPHSMI